MYQPVPSYTETVPPSTNQYRTGTAPGQLKTGNVAWGLQTFAQFTPGVVSNYCFCANSSRELFVCAIFYVFFQL